MGDEKKILTEFFELEKAEPDVHKLRERSRKEYENEDATYLTGLMAVAGEENGNGRIYPKNVLQREVENYKKLIRENRALGECDHPDASVVSLEDASHMVTRIWWDGPKKVKGNVKVLDTDAGQNVQALLDGGVKLGISSRGLGSVREEQGSLIVENDFQLIAFDFVSDPSTTGAFMLQENQNPQNSEHFRKEDKVNRILNDIVT